MLKKKPNNIFSRVELLRSFGQRDNHQPVGKCGKVGSSLTFGQFCPLAYNHTLTSQCRPPITAAQLSLELEVCTPQSDICTPPLLNREHDSVVLSRTCRQKMLVDITVFKMLHGEQRLGVFCVFILSYFKLGHLICQNNLAEIYQT